jgi:cell division protease FtsH
LRNLLESLKNLTAMLRDQIRRRAPAVLQTLITVGLVLLLWFPFLPFLQSNPAQVVPYSEFLQAVRDGRVQAVQISSGDVRGMLRQEQSGKPAVQPHILSAIRPPDLYDPDLLPLLRSKGVEVVGKIDTPSFWRSLLVSALPMLLLIGFWAWVIRRMGRGSEALQFGRNRAKIYNRTEREKATFSDVAGVDESRAELIEIVDFLRNPEKYQRLGGRIPKGVLLVGPPGTGKTLLARAVAGEAEVPFFSISGSEFIELFVGVGAARVRDLFEEAKKHAPCIVFIDELDAIGKSRAGVLAGVAGGHDEREQTLNQLLVEMDGFDSSKGVIIMAATNRPEVLDPALLRPGRFDRQVVVDRPDLSGREAILRVHARKIKLADGVDLHVIAARTPGMVGADLANIVNEAALLAARRGGAAVEMRDLEEAIDRVTLGLEKRTRVMTPAEKERVAYHETGHALTALSVKYADPVHRITIIPRSIGALGATLQLPTTEKYLLTKPELEDRVAVMLGGRAAEDIIYNGVISTGAHNDLERATETARQMVMRYGMSERLGNQVFGKPVMGQYLESTLSFGEQCNFSEHTAERIDEEVAQLMDRTYQRVKGLLSRRRRVLERITAELQKRETIDRVELEKIVAEAEPTPAPVVA